MTVLFPPGIAEGEAFCNRVSERKQLSSNIERNNHTVIMAPRRYGKSSLLNYVIQDKGLLYSWSDFLSVATQEDVESKILKAAKLLLMKLSPELKKIQRQATDFAKSLTPEVSLGALGQSVTFHLGGEVKTSIDEVLLQLDAYAVRVKKKGVLVFDEFQQISELKESAAIEALIRHAVERSKNITYVFSGSNRHLLQEMFGESSRPLYRLCQPMTIDRIHAHDYEKFINAAGQERWGEKLSQEALEVIFSLTECHPFYVNALCNQLWFQDNLPTQDSIRAAWHHYITAYKGIITSDILNLSLNQKKILQALSNKPEAEPYSANFCARTKVSLSSVRQSLDALIAKDIVYIKEKTGYSLVDPALRYYLVNF